MNNNWYIASICDCSTLPPLNLSISQPFHLSAILTPLLSSLSTCHPIYCPPFYSSTCEPFYPTTLLLLNLSTYQPVSHPTPPPFYPSILQSVDHSRYPSTLVLFTLSICQPFYPLDPSTFQLVNHSTSPLLCSSTFQPINLYSPSPS